MITTMLNFTRSELNHAARNSKLERPQQPLVAAWYAAVCARVSERYLLRHFSVISVHAKAFSSPAETGLLHLQREHSDTRIHRATCSLRRRSPRGRWKFFGGIHSSTRSHRGHLQFLMKRSFLTTMHHASSSRSIPQEQSQEPRLKG